MRSGQAAAALIVPSDIPAQIESLVTQGVGNPTVELILNSKDPLERQFAEQTINARVNEVEQAVSKQVLRVAVNDLHQVLNGGKLQFLGPERAAARVCATRGRSSRGRSPRCRRTRRLRPALTQVVNFANLAIQGLGFASPVLGSIGKPLTVDHDRARRQDHADRHVRRRDRRDRLADVRDAAAGLRPARARALGERLLAAGARARLAVGVCCRRRSALSARVRGRA